MRADRWRCAVFCAGLLVALLAFQGVFFEARAVDAKDLLKQVNKELRQAERDMFGGKAEKAIASLENIKAKLSQAKEADPNNPKVKSYESKFKKLVKDLERRTGKDLGGGSLTAAQASTETDLPSKPEAKPLEKTEAAQSEPAQGEADELAKEAGSLILKAERNMFSGKNEEAASQLDQAASMIAGIKAQDAGHAKLASLERDFGQVQKKLEAKMPKAGSSTETQLPPKPEVKPLEKKEAAQPAQETQEAKPAKEAQAAPKQAAADAKLPYNARRPAEMAGRDLERIEGSMEKLGNPDWNQDQLLDNMNKSLESARKNLESARAEAEKKGVTSHPEFDALEARIQEAEQKIAGAVQGVAESKEAAAASANEVTADVDALKATYDRVLPVLEKATGSVMYYNKVEETEALIDQIEQFEKNDLAKIQEQMAAFGEKYGTTKDAIDQKADAMGYVNNYYRASFAYTELEKGIANVAKTRTVMADDLVRKAEEMKTRTSKGIHDFARLKQHDRIKAWGRMAARFDADNPRVKAFNDEIDAWAKADAKALNAKIDKATFPKQASDAPKDAKKLVKEAVAFLQKEEDKLAAEKGKEVSKVLAVVVTGPWRVFKKNILGEPIQYNLPIATAVQTKSEKEKNLARVYLSTMLTQEMKGVKMAPPYLGATVGDSYYIRPSAIK